MGSKTIEVIDDWGGNVTGVNPGLGDIVRITDNFGNVVESVWRPVPSVAFAERNFLHITSTGGDGKPRPGIESDGVDPLVLVFTVRQTKDPESEIITSVGRFEEIIIRDSDNVIHDYIRIDFVKGVATATYTTVKPGLLSISKGDISFMVGDAEVSLESKFTFRAYRSILT